MIPFPRVRAVAAAVIVAGLTAMPGSGVPRPVEAQSTVPDTASASVPHSPEASVLVDDFESSAPGTFPNGWVYVTRDREIVSHEEAQDPGEEVVVRQEDGNQFLRVLTRDSVVRYTKRNGVDFQWNLAKRPLLQWRWRALELPEGANEREDNDVGAAIYVTFGTDWLGRPKSIKYTYSSALPVGTVVEFGSLYVIVVDSRPASGVGTWQTVTRHVAKDYRKVFDEEPPTRPAGITFWGDSDTTHDASRADFDDIRLLPQFYRKR